jgi:hypothetical protein
MRTYMQVRFLTCQLKLPYTILNVSLHNARRLRYIVNGFITKVNSAVAAVRHYSYDVQRVNINSCSWNVSCDLVKREWHLCVFPEANETTL